MSDLNYFSGRVDYASHGRFPESPDQLKSVLLALCMFGSLLVGDYETNDRGPT